MLAAVAADAGDAKGQCGSGGSKLRVGDRTEVCVGFAADDRRAAGGGGAKAVWYPRVDEYSSIAVDALEPVVSGAAGGWEQYAFMWLGVAGQRTVGQERGVKSADGACLRDGGGGGGGGGACFGWALHNKPLLNTDRFLASSLTAVVHLDNGAVSRIAWDDGCTMCPRRSDDESSLLCLSDNTSIVCSEGDDSACTDCYQAAGPGCFASSGACTPTIFLAWTGSDSNGRPLRSGGKIFSRFSQ